MKIYLIFANFIQQWWGDLSVGQQFYWGLALLATFILLIQMTLILIGGDFDGDGADVGDVIGEVGEVGEVGEFGDVDVDADSSDEFHTKNDIDHNLNDLKFISVKTFTAFLLGFGWTGAIFVKIINPFLAALPAFFVGVFMMFIIFKIMQSISKLEEKGNILIYNCVGNYASVYLPIPPEFKGKGKIQIVVQDRLREFDAQTNAKEKILNNKKVLVIDVKEDNTLIVKPV